MGLENPVVPPPVKVSFGPFVFDSEARELRRQGAPLSLSPKAFQLLEALLEGRPRALPKAALQERLWPKTFVVEANLANLVAEIRAVLGDSRKKPRFVRTVHGFGYAFLGAPVAEPPGLDTGTEAASFLHRVLWGKRVLPLGPGENVLGRGEDVALRIDAPGVSRRHARILVEGDRTTLEDLGSKNGTFLQGRRLKEPAFLADGDAFRLGRHPLVYQSAALKESTQTDTGLE